MMMNAGTHDVLGISKANLKTSYSVKGFMKNTLNNKKKLMFCQLG